MHRLLLLFPILAFGVWLATGCAPKAYKDALHTGSTLEQRGDYESAYKYYEEAVRLRPNDKIAQAKLNQLGRLISSAATEKGIQAFENKKYRTASELFTKALHYNANNQDARSYNEKAKTQYNLIRKKYSEADRLKAQSEWVDAVHLLNEIS
ncbi:MAG: tetratricopeptide repeat protein, partial [Thermodesulfobacteriota bacterium]|nr:tetratricopeptide repeat protein [Thermodesulfobacteriota bacterium]